MNLTIDEENGEFCLRYRGTLVLQHSEHAPVCYIGHGDASMDMYRGNFEIEDFVDERIPLRRLACIVENGCMLLRWSRSADDAVLLEMRVEEVAQGMHLTVTTFAPGLNRLWWRIPAEAGEHVWGCGEQMSYFDLRGRHFPLWTSEPGVGRDKSTLLTWQADVAGKSGGDYYHTNYPQPTFISSRRYCLHAETTAYADFDFRHDAFHELQFWAIPQRLEFMFDTSFIGLVTQISTRFGRQPPLPEWLQSGAMLGLKGGEEHARTVLAKADRHGLAVSALWCEDWVGLRETSFGKRLFWDWRWQPERYPGLKQWIPELAARGVRFLGYVNPYLCNDGALYCEARRLGFLATRPDGGDYLVDFGEFDCGVVDFTNPDAARWFEDRILRQEMLDFGLAGWMADFGEYLPIDLCLANGVDAREMHNAWPTLWAEVNARALERAGRTGDATFFMRAGYTGVQRHCPLLWAGDQSVDFSRHDGLQTVICGALSSGLMGNAYHHSDIGGYTSLFGNVRTAELFQRWAEMAVFSALMRTHEGNRPDQNFQFHQDSAVMAHFACMTALHVALAPYFRTLVEEARTQGLPLQRPLFLHYEDDAATYAIQDQYLFGPDLLVAPVHQAGRTTWRAYLPAGDVWLHFWSGKAHDGGQTVEVPAPLGQPPVFVRRGCVREAFFLALAVPLQLP